jgi:hypothetical protein
MPDAFVRKKWLKLVGMRGGGMPSWSTEAALSSKELDEAEFMNETKAVAAANIP